MAVSTVGSLSEIFTAGVPLQTEDAAPAVGANQDKPPRSPSNLDPIVEDAEDAEESGPESDDADSVARMNRCMSGSLVRRY